jgi:hypothetical protein
MGNKNGRRNYQGYLSSVFDFLKPNDGLPELEKYLRENPSDVLPCAHTLANITTKEVAQVAVLELGGSRLLKMFARSSDPNVQHCAVHTVSNMASNENIQARIAQDKWAERLLELLWSTDRNVRLKSARALANLAMHPPNKVLIAKRGGIGALLKLLKEAGGDNGLVVETLAVLGNLAVDPGVELAIGRQGGIELIVPLLTSEHGGVMGQAERAVNNLSANFENREKIDKLMAQSESEVVRAHRPSLILPPPPPPEDEDNEVGAGGSPYASAPPPGEIPFDAESDELDLPPLPRGSMAMGSTQIGESTYVPPPMVPSGSPENAAAAPPVYRPESVGDAATPPPPGIVSLLETQVFQALNLARTQPLEMARLIEQRLQYLGGDNVFKFSWGNVGTTEGRTAYEGAIEFLKAVTPMAGFTLSPGMTSAAQGHVEDIGPTGNVGHVGSDGRRASARANAHGNLRGAFGEAIEFGPWQEGSDFVIGLIVDDGRPSRDHRKLLFNPKIEVCGVGAGDHIKFGKACVMMLAHQFDEN